jgi:low temperature requirement protein LtrA
VFVLAVGQLAHLIVAEPEPRSVWIALGLFVVLWWTWVGFAVLYNRHGIDDARSRLVVLAGSIPAGVAAVAVEPAAAGDSTMFACSLAVTRVMLAGAYAVAGGHADALRLRVARACLFSAALLLVSVWAPPPLRYLLWAVAIAAESGAMLTDDRAAVRRARREHDFGELTPTDPSEALDAHHIAERFGLCQIILIGEVVVEAGQAAVDGTAAGTAGWAALVAAMLLAAGLWWLYFDSTAEINLRVLELSGGSPTIARAIFAVGHMLPAFALLVVSAGVGLLLEDDPPKIAYWLACLGAGLYLAGTRTSFGARRRRAPWVVRLVLLLAIFQLGRLWPELGPYAYLWLLTGCVGLCAVLNEVSAPSARSTSKQTSATSAISAKPSP